MNITMKKPLAARLLPFLAILLAVALIGGNSFAATPASLSPGSSSTVSTYRATHDSSLSGYFYGLGQRSGFAPEAGQYWCVDDNPTPQPTAAPCNNGLTFNNLQTAINQATSGDYILLAGGTYLGSGNAVAVLSFPLTMIGGYAGGNGPTSWTQTGASTLSVLDGQGLRRGVEVQGAITVNLENFTVSNGGVLNNSGTVNVTLPPVSPNTCTLNIGSGGVSNGHFDINTVAAVCFPSGNQTLTNGTSFTGAGVMRLNGGTVTIGTVNTEVVTATWVELSGGTLTGVGTFIVNTTLDWKGGTMDGPFVNDTGTTTIPSGAIVNMSGVGTTKTLLQRTFNNNGTVRMNGTGTGTFNMGDLAVFNNYGSFIIQNNDSLLYSVGEHPTFNNVGTVSKTAGSGTSTFGSSFLLLDSSGSISVLTGTLSLDGGAAGGFNGVVTGPITASVNSTLRFGGVAGSNHNLGPTSSITGAGNVTFSNGNTTIAGVYNVGGVTTISGGTVQFNTNASSASAVESSGTLKGNGDFSTDVLLWTGGTMDNGDTLAGTTTIRATGVLTVAGVSSSKFLLGRVFNNNGRAVVNGTGTGTLFIGDQAVFNNNAGASFDFQNNDSVSFQAGTTAAIFINNGTLTKTGGSGTSTLGTGSLSFNNEGSVQVMTGTLSLDGGGSDDGSFVVDPRANLRFNGGTHLLGSSSSITGAGGVIFNSGTANIIGTYAITGLTTISGGTARFDSNATTTNALMSSGTLTGTGTVDIIALAWNGGTMNGPGVTNIDATGVMTLGGVSTSKFMVQRTVNNNGHAFMNGTGTGALYLGDNATFNNTPGATFEIQNNDSIMYSNGTIQPAFNNDGNFKKSGGAGISTVGSSSLPFNNNGTVDVLTGTISLDGGGVSGGVFNISSVAVLRFNAGVSTLQPGSSIAGAGNVTMNGGTANIAGLYNITGITNVTGGVLNFNSTGTTTNANLINGIIGGTGSFTVTDTLNWNGGSMNDPGSTNLPPGATLNIGGVSTSKYLRQRTFNNGGVAYMNGTGTGTLFLGAGAVLHNLVGATYNIVNNDSILYESGTAPIINNDGTLRKSSGLGISNVGSGSLVFNNNGTVDVLSGVLNFGVSVNQSAGTTSLNGGNISTTGTFNLSGGTLIGTGIVTGTVVNSGEIRPGTSPGTLTVNGTYRQNNAGALTVEVAGTTPGTEYDQFRVKGTATLSGTLNVTLLNGYLPNIGDAFQVLTYTTRSGLFTAYTGLVLTGGRSFSPEYNATNFTLLVVPGSITPTPVPTSTGVPTTPTPGATPTGCVIHFTDVAQTDYFYEPVRYLFCNNVISGYTTSPPCTTGTPCFKPYNQTTRGQLSKIITLALNWPIDTTNGPHFQDTAPGSTFYNYVETSFNHGIINGYPCGGAGEPCVPPDNHPYFRPNNNVTRAQLTKIVVLAMGWTQVCPQQNTFSDVPRDNVFYCYVETAVVHGVINGYPDGTFRPNNSATRGQISKIVYLAVTTP